MPLLLPLPLLSNTHTLSLNKINKILKKTVPHPCILPVGPPGRLLERLTLIVLFNGQDANSAWLLGVLVPVRETSVVLAGGLQQQYMSVTHP